MKTLITLTLALVSGFAQASDWVEIAKTKDKVTVYKLKADSGKVVNGYASVIITETTKGKISVQKVSISISDCLDGFGTASTWDGTHYFNNNFAFDAGNVGSRIAEFTCLWAQAQARVDADKDSKE